MFVISWVNPDEKLAHKRLDDYLEQGVPIDLSRVKLPLYFISTVEDHIAPWRSTYAGARLFSGPVRFVLGGSGHIAGITIRRARKSTATGPTRSCRMIPRGG